MKYIGRVLGWILLGINICMAVLLLICAYSSYINPVAHPVWSCAGLAFPAFLITNVLFFLLVGGISQVCFGVSPDFFLLLWCHPYLYTYQSVRERTSRGCRQSIVIQYDGF